MAIEIDQALLDEATEGREKMFSKLRKLTRLVNDEGMFGVQATPEEIEELRLAVADIACAVADRFDLEQDLVRECVRAGERSARAIAATAAVPIAAAA